MLRKTSVRSNRHDSIRRLFRELLWMGVLGGAGLSAQMVSAQQLITQVPNGQISTGQSTASLSSQLQPVQQSVGRQSASTGLSPVNVPAAPPTTTNPNFNALDSAVQSTTSRNAASQITVQTYPVPSQLVGTVSAQLQLQYHNVPGITITNDPRTEQLMVVAPAAIQQQISDSLSRLIHQNAIPLGDQGIDRASHAEKGYVLRNLTWRELEDSISKLAGSKLEVTTENNGEVALLKVPNQLGLRDILRVDRRNNQVTILGTAPTAAAWTQVIHSLDAGQADPNATTHIVPLAPAQPRSVRRMVQLVSTRAAQQQNPQEEDPNAPATAVIDKLGQTSDSGLLGDVQIEVVDSVGLIIIKGSKRDVQRTLQVIEQIKAQAKTTEPLVEILQLQHSNSEAVATLVNQLYETVYQPRQGSVSITALIQPNALLLIGRPEVVQSVKELIAKIDTPLEPTDQLKVIRLEHASAVDLETRIRDFFAGTTGAAATAQGATQPAGQNRGLATRVKIASDYRTNALIVQASPRELEEVQKVIKQLDVESAETENRVRVFPLKHAIAQELQQVVTQILTGQAATTGGQQGGGIQPQGQAGGQGANAGRVTTPSGRLTIDGVDGEKVESGILAGVIVSADPSVNALVVRAPAPSIPLIAALIEQLDVLPSAEARIKFFQLKNSDATTVALTLQNLYGLSPSAGLGSQFQLQNTFAQNVARSFTAGGDSTLVQLRITAEARSNSVIISGSEADLQVIEALILRLDEDQRDSRRSEVIWLRNALAANVSTALQTYFQNFLSTQTQLVQTQVISPQELVNRQVFVVPEETTNSVLISASPKLFDVALALVERLDRRPPMVTVEVLIAEIQLDDSFELGAELGLQDSLLFTRRSSTGGTLTSPVFNPLTTLASPTVGPNVAGQGLSAFGVGRSNAAGVGGMVLAASSETVGILVRALQTAGRLQVLNRPTLTTLENREASSQVGASVPRVTSVGQATVNVPQTIQTEDVPVGILLQILPRVSPDGLIVMDVGVENSSVGNPDDGIPIGFGPNGQAIRSPIINSTRAQTVVSAYSGQTVVFAGLISKTRSTSRSQVPFLGSLPLIGAAFRFDIESEIRKELLVVLTPRIVQTDEDYENLKQVESSRMSWCLADVVNLNGDVGLSGGNGLWGPARGSMMYPDRPLIKVPDRAPVDLENNYPIYGGEQYLPGIETPLPIETVPGEYQDQNVSKQNSLKLQQASFRQTPPETTSTPLNAAGSTGQPLRTGSVSAQKGSY